MGFTEKIRGWGAKKASEKPQPGNKRGGFVDFKVVAEETTPTPAIPELTSVVSPEMNNPIPFVKTSEPMGKITPDTLVHIPEPPKEVTPPAVNTKEELPKDIADAVANRDARAEERKLLRMEQFLKYETLGDFAHIEESEERLSDVYTNAEIHEAVVQMQKGEKSRIQLERFFKYDPFLLERMYQLTEKSADAYDFSDVYTLESFTNKIEGMGEITGEDGHAWKSEEIVALLKNAIEHEGKEAVPVLKMLPTEYGLQDAALRILHVDAEAFEFDEERQKEALDAHLGPEDDELEKEDDEIKPLKSEQEFVIGRDFEKRFNLKQENLVTVEGWEELSLGQKKLVLENLAQVTMGRIEEVAKEKYTSGVTLERNNRTIFGHKFLANAWISIREGFLSEKKVLENEKEEEARVRAGGMAVHGEMLAKLVSEMKERGPEANFSAKGELVVNYGKELEGMSESCKEALVVFNELAHRESNETYEDNLVRSRKELSEEKKNRSPYEEAKAHLMEEMEKSGISRRKVLEYITDVDSRVTMNQFQTSRPDAINALGDIEDRGFWGTIGKSIGVERGLYTAGGFALRSVGTAAFGFIAAPLNAAVIGGFRSWDRAKAELRERDRAQRKGSSLQTETALNMIKADGERGAVEKLHMLLERVRDIDIQMELILADKNEEHTPEEIVTLTLDEEQLRTERAGILKSLTARLEFTEDKLRLGRVNFGEEESVNQYNLLRALAEAKIRLQEVDFDGVNGVKKEELLDARIDRFLNFKEEKISKIRRKYVRREVAEGALIAGGYGLLGALIGQIFGGGSGATEKGPSLEGKISELEPHVQGATESIVFDEPSIYRIEKGDTVINILRTEIPEYAEIGRGQLQDTAIANHLNLLSPQEWRDEIGISSGDPNKINIDETFNLSRYQELIEEKRMLGK